MKQTLFRTLVASAALAMALTSWAGWWRVTYSSPGSGAKPLVGGPITPYADVNGGHGGGYPAVSCSGKILADFTWQSSTGEEPPESVFIEETSNAYAQKIDGLHPQGISAANGFGHEAVLSSRSIGHPTWLEKTDRSNGTRVTWKYLGGARNFQVSASPSASGPLSAGVYYSARVVEMAVAIRLDRDITYERAQDHFPGVAGASGNDRVANYEPPTLTPRPGDTGLPLANEPGQQVWANLTFHRDLIGTWHNPLHIWNIDGHEYRDWLFGEYEEVSIQIPFTDEQVQSLARMGPRKVRAKLTVINDGGDGVSASADYTLEVHAIVDKVTFVEHGEPYYKDIEVTADNPGYAIAGGGINCTWMGWPVLLGPAIDLMSGVGSAMAANPYVAAFLTAAGVIASELVPQPMSGVAPWAWNWQGSVITGGDWSQDPQRFVMYPRLDERYDPSLYEGRLYAFNGYERQAREWVGKHTGFRWRGSFVLFFPED